MKSNYVAVFGYGSLVAPHEMEQRAVDGRPKPHYAILHDHERNWEVLVGWAPQSGLYLGIAPHKGWVVNGCIFYVDQGGLKSLDQRERVYHRTRVDGMVSRYPNPRDFVDGPIYTYLPDTFAVADAKKAINVGDGFISKRYDTIVNEAFKAVGPGFMEMFLITTRKDHRIKIEGSHQP